MTPSLQILRNAFAFLRILRENALQIFRHIGGRPRLYFLRYGLDAIFSVLLNTVRRPHCGIRKKGWSFCM